MKVLDSHRCPICGGPLTYVVLGNVEEDGQAAADIPEAGELAMCIRCVSLVLCKATVAIHGDLGDGPQSHNFPDHEVRMRAHGDRIGRLGLAQFVEDTIPVSIPA